LSRNRAEGFETMRIHLIPNSHIDPVWLWDKYEGIDEVLSTFRTACDLLDEHPSLTFTASSIQFYEWVLRHDPALFARIQAWVEAGRWEVVGCWWVESDTNLPTWESFRYQAEISQRFCAEHFGSRSRVVYLPDTFGHPADLPTVLRDTGTFRPTCSIGSTRVPGSWPTGSSSTTARAVIRARPGWPRCWRTPSSGSIRPAVSSSG
jgi:alpha-mannosidase